MVDNGGGFWRSVRQLPDRTPLRVKLITAVLALVAVALAVISFAGIGLLKDHLLGQYDSELATSFNHVVFSEVGPYLGGGGGTPAQGNEFAVDWVQAGGKLQQVVVPVSSGFGRPGVGAEGAFGTAHAIPGPVIPSSASWLAANVGHPITVAAQSGGGRWRVLMQTEQFSSPSGGTVTGTVILAVNVSTVYATIGQLAATDLLVSLVVVFLLAIVGIAVVRASLRPLTDIEETAGAIAAGDLTRRVPERDPRTEIGRLGRSLNTMLSQIETAFRAQARSEAAARRSEERMRQFVTDASHELRTPLTAIRGFAEYYRQRGGISSPAAAAEATGAEPGAAAAAGNGYGQLQRTDLDRIMRRVEQESSRMGVLVEDMLLLARLDQQRPLERSTVDLLTLAADAVHDARVVAPDRSINLTVGSGSALLVLGDEVRLRQVIGNLMSNALSHTPGGTPIELMIRSGSLAEADADGVYGPAAAQPGAAQADGAQRDTGTATPAAAGSGRAAVLEVADHGAGLTPEQAEHVFERFYRADQARTVGGTGLGLAIVASLVAAHGGAVWVESPPGGGAIFRIALPLAPEALADDPEPEDAGDTDLPADASLNPDSDEDSGPDTIRPGEPDVMDSSARGGRSDAG